MPIYAQFKVAAVHAAPVFLDAQATVDKACDLIAEAARNGAHLVAFPETYVPAFPVWSALRAPIHNHDLFRRLAANTVRVPGPELTQVANAAREHEVLVGLGVNEGTDSSVGCIFNSYILIDSDGAILNHHRKLVPTFYEKLTWAAGDGAGLRVSETQCGRVGALICGENTNPLARYTLIAQGEQVHLSCYPPVWPTHNPATAPNYDVPRAIRLRAGAHSFEGKLFNVVSSSFMDRAMRDALLDLDSAAGSILDGSPRGISLVFGPSGEPITEALSDEEGIVYADVDTSLCVEPKQLHDIAGGYNRFDVFELTVDRRASRPVRFRSDMSEDNSDEVDRDQYDKHRDRPEEPGEPRA